LVPQAYSRRKKNSDSLGSSGIIDENAPEQTSACRKEINKNSGIPDDPFIEEKIYYDLKGLIVPQRDKLLVTELAVTRLKEMKMKFQKMTHPTGEKGILLHAKVG
jgi:hypothetical protein